ncbi:MAG: hypothetical protein SGBAC_003957 [Bacillariaceae sp.]
MTTRSERNESYLDEMKNVTPSRATVEQAIARARARRVVKKPKQSPRNLRQTIALKKNQSTLEPDACTRSADPSASKKPSSPTKEFFQNVFASRSTTISPTHASRDRSRDLDSRRSCRMADPPTSSDAPSVHASAPVTGATSQDEEREDGDTVSPAPSIARGKGGILKTFQAEKVELESVAESKECDFGMRNLPGSPSMKSDTEDDRDDNWELKGMASEETMKATGNSRRTRPHKGIFVRKGKKKKSDDDEDGKVIRSLFSVDSSIAPVDALFDQESCFFDDDEDEDDFDDEVSEEEPRKADPPDSSPVEATGNDGDVAEDVAVAPKVDEAFDEASRTEQVEVPWDKKGTSFGHVEKLVASIKAKKVQKQEQAVADQTEGISSKAAADSDPTKQGQENEEPEEYEDFVGDFLQSGSGDDVPQHVDNAAETNGNLLDRIAGEIANDSLIVDEIEKCETQNAFLDQFKALGIEEESPRKKPIISKGEDTETTLTSNSAETKPKKPSLPDGECSTEEDPISMATNIQQESENGQTKDGINKTTNEEKAFGEEVLNESSPNQPQVETVDSTDDQQDSKQGQTKDTIGNTINEEQAAGDKAINGSPIQPEVEIVDSKEDSVDSDYANAAKQSVAEDGVVKEAMEGSILDDDNSGENGNMQDIREDEKPKNDVPEEPIYIFRFAKGISEEDWLEKNEMASEWHYKSSSMPLNGVEAVENIHRFTHILNKEPEPRPWKVSHKQRASKHPGFKPIDINSLLESTEVIVSEQTHDDYIPWEHRDVKQLFLQERSVEFARNWFGKNHTHKVNSKFKLPVCQPKSMEMPLGIAEDAVEWNKDVYTTWKSPYHKVEYQGLELNNSGDETNNSENKEETQNVQQQSHLVNKRDTKDDNDEHSSHASEYDDEESYSDGSYSDGSYTDSEGSYDSGEGSSDALENGSAIVVDGNTTWEDAPECGRIVNVSLKIGEHVTRVHPAYTTSLRRSRWRKKYFPKGSFPY